MPPKLSFSPPILNSACPWATDLSHLRPLYASPSTGAITTRTSLPTGFPHNDDTHRFLFFDPCSPTSHTPSNPPALPSTAAPYLSASLNNLGYSPHPLSFYLDLVSTLATDFPLATKPVIISVTGSPADIAASYTAVAARATTLSIPLALEINLSCPNIPSTPPPAYTAAGLAAVLDALPSSPAVPVGIKTPPYTHAGQFAMLTAALAAGNGAAKISFVTATNTLGSCLVLGEDGAPVLPGSGVGGMAGAALHPLALGNVAALRKAFDETPGLEGIDIIGVGGVGDAAGFKRMTAAGAKFVALATALGKQGVQVFDKIVETH
ncbi:hypothetical protein TD95_004045 [Thielaviopsis punctulata]|uniref:Dihydroorotate dehydrogenase catalytic domain-containing protein n=1 Tax=Thielaviopsis punctulata TaxID=72032 RepID=A0A0F4ZFY8_9PEZI|nr:hypothetical protein TD95_004045 [Thielaviopsis punctulata]